MRVYLKILNRLKLTTLLEEGNLPRPSATGWWSRRCIATGTAGERLRIFWTYTTYGRSANKPGTRNKT